MTEHLSQLWWNRVLHNDCWLHLLIYGLSHNPCYAGLIFYYIIPGVRLSSCPLRGSPNITHPSVDIHNLCSSVTEDFTYPHSSPLSPPQNFFLSLRFFFLPPRVVVVVSHCPLQRELRGSVLGVSQGEAGPLLSCRLCPSCLQATLLSTGVQRAPQAPLCLRASGPRNVAGHFVKQLGRGQARP